MIQKREARRGQPVAGDIPHSPLPRAKSMKRAIEGISAVDGLSLGGMIRVEAMR